MHTLQIIVSFTKSTPTPATTVVECHAYRNDVLVAKFTADQFADPGSSLTYVDSGSAAPITYQRIATKRGPLETVQSVGAGPFSADTPIVYRITVLYGTLDSAGQTMYTETEIGRSNTITPFG